MTTRYNFGIGLAATIFSILALVTASEAATKQDKRKAAIEAPTTKRAKSNAQRSLNSPRTTPAASPSTGYDPVGKD
jgi:hypothetical protein